MGEQQHRDKYEKTERENNPEIFLQRAEAEMALRPC